MAKHKRRISTIAVFPGRPFQPTQWASLPPRDPHKDWKYDEWVGVEYLRVLGLDSLKLCVLHPRPHDTSCRWINKLTGEHGDSPTAHAAKVAVEQDLVEHLRKMLRFMGAS